MYAAQAAGCAPVVRALEAGIEYPEPVRPDTIAKSIAIGNPADGYQVVRSVRIDRRRPERRCRMTRSSRRFGCWPKRRGSSPSRPGGTTVAAAVDLISRGVIPRDEPTVICVTGNGYKTSEVVAGRLAEPVRLSRRFNDFESWLEARQAIA